MTRSAKMVVLINPSSPAAEDEFNQWYDAIHIPQVIERIPGIIRAQRLRLTAEQLEPDESLPARRYLTIYDIETDDLRATADRLGQALGDGTLDLSDAVDLTREGGPLIHYYEAPTG